MRKATGDPVHQRAAGLAEVAVHLIARCNAMFAFILGEIGLSLNMLDSCIFLVVEISQMADLQEGARGREAERARAYNGKVGCMH